MCVKRLLLLADPPSLDAGEMTDKGSINQAAVLNYRSDLVAELYREPASTRAIAIDDQNADGAMLPRLMRRLWRS